MSLAQALELDAERGAVRDAVATFCREQCDDARVKAAEGQLDRALWKQLAALGVLSVAIPDAEEGGPLELVAACEALGAAAFPGPLVESVLALPLLGPAEREAVACGERVVAVGRPPLLAWAPEAELFVAVEPGRAWLGRPRGPVEPVATLGGDPWGRVSLEPLEELGDPTRALEGARLASAAYLVGAGTRLVEDASAHARARRQFGRPIGSFQAVAHPLADAATRLRASAMLVRTAARALCEGVAAAPALVAGARLSAREAALDVAHLAHQVFGAVGITLEGPVFHVSRRIRHLASALPGDAAAREAVLGALDAEGATR